MCRGAGDQPDLGVSETELLRQSRDPLQRGGRGEELHTGHEGRTWKEREGASGPCSAGWRPMQVGRRRRQAAVSRDDSGCSDSVAQLLAAALLPHSQDPQVWAALLQLRWTCGESSSETCWGRRKGSWGTKKASPAASPLSESMPMLAGGRKLVLKEAVFQASKQGRGQGVAPR